jgi:chromosome segregation protein
VFLKRVVLQGFKSFADRTEFDFGSGITCIVGPNGCGKSNVVDAIRWVLGEQSAKSLRGGRMADVIFAGSRSRKPANFAEVELTFDNRAGILHSDAEEVVVTRVLYRNGDSEYRRDGKGCRLKDIKELLLDTGVGVDAYSVIEQGRVDSLLQANPVERREIFEEAAGISRYKVRRLEAQRKLERTQANLLRLQDVLDELEKRLRSVKLAAGKARSFMECDARLRELRCSFSLAEYHELEQTRIRSQSESETLASQVQEQRAALAARDAEAAELEHARQALDERIQAADAALREAETTLSALAERIAQGERRSPELAAARERRLTQAAELTEQAARHRARLCDEEAAGGALQDEERGWEGRIAELLAARAEAEQKAAASRAALEAEKSAAFELARQGARLQNERENLRQQGARLAAQAQRLNERRAQLAGEREGGAQRRAVLTAKLAELDRKVAEWTAAEHAATARLAELASETERLETDIGTAKETRSALTSRLAVLEDLDQRLEGVAQGTRAVLAWRDEDATRTLVAGLVADVLRIDDPRVAILQPILETFESHVAVRDTPAFLAELERRGVRPEPLRVILLDRLTSAPLPLKYDHAPGFVACAADWVSCAAEFRPLAQHLLGRTIVVETLDVALRLAGEALTGCTFVTLAGEMVGSDGRLTIGAGHVTTGLISRKAEIRQVRGELDDCESRLVGLTRGKNELDAAASDAELQRSGLLQRIAATQREHADTRHELTRTRESHERLDREERLLLDELAGVQRGVAEVEGRSQTLVTEQEQVSAAETSHEARIAALAEGVARDAAAAQTAAEECTAALVERGRVVERRRGAEQALADLRARCATLERERQSAAEEAAAAAEQITVAERELEQARVEHAALSADCDRQRAQTLVLRAQRQEQRQRLEGCAAAERETQRRLEEIEAAWHARQVELRECEVRMENLVARVQDELALGLPDLYARYQHAEQDWEAIKNEIEELKGKIARLGNVNLDALAELEELTPRYEHLVAQRTDLTDAVTRLEALIAELDQESQQRFGAAFAEIREHFQEMFRKIFGGGKADVYLEDPERPLECGIEIVARPPGKEPQTLTLLSGGEKTMTAVALLMAVFRSRPSPFAFLDEVDAALDEANIERFNNVLQEFLTRSQFVVITHNKRTMASADVLYGVTMEEPGVSKRMSVRFEERVITPSVA